jgi:hypothetical protein
MKQNLCVEQKIPTRPSNIIQYFCNDAYVHMCTHVHMSMHTNMHLYKHTKNDSTRLHCLTNLLHSIIHTFINQCPTLLLDSTYYLSIILKATHTEILQCFGLNTGTEILC